MSKTTIVLTVFVFLLSLIPLLWFPGKAILLGYDNVYPLAPISFLYDRVYSWSWVIGFGSDQAAIQGSLLIHIIDAFPQILGFSQQASQKIVFSFWFFLILFSAYVFARTLEKHTLVTSPYVKYFFPVLYAVNFYMLQAWWIAERTKFSLVVATPLILSILLPFIGEHFTKRNVIRAGILSALVLSLFNGGGWVGISLFGGLLASLFCFYLFSLFLIIREKQFKEIIYLHLYFVVFLTVFLLINAYTVLPFLKTTLSEYTHLLERSGGIDGILNWTRYLSEDTSFINLFRLQGIPDWYNTIYHPYSLLYLRNPFLIFASFTFPVLLFSSFLTKRIDKKIMAFFLFLLLFSLFLTAGTHEPLGSFFEILVDKVPGFVIFRSAIFKFGYAYWLAASFFISLILSEIVSFISWKKVLGGFRLSPLFVFFVFLCLILVYHFPFFTGDFFHVDRYTAASRTVVPPYVSSFAKWWQSEGKNQRILLLPQLNNDWYFEIYTWNYLSLNPVLANYGSNGIVQNTVLLTPAERDTLMKLYDAIDEEHFEEVDQLTSLLGIRFFLLRNDFFSEYPGFETDSPSVLSKKLEKIPGLVKTKRFDKWEVYAFASDKSLVNAVSTSSISDGGFAEEISPENEVLLSKADPSFPISQVIIHATCVSCQAEQQATSVEFPTPKILLDSNLYKLKELREEMRKKKQMTFDDGVYQLVGESLNYASQLKQLIERDRGDYFVHLAREKYLGTLTSLAQRIGEITSQSDNPYSMAVILQNYFDAQMQLLNDLVLKTSKKEQQIDIEILLGQLERNNQRLQRIMKKSDFNIRRVYSISVDHEGEYQIALEKSTLGVVDDPLEVRLSVGNLMLAPSDSGEYLQFGEVTLNQGTSEFWLLLPKQRSVLSTPVMEERAGRVCYDSLVEGFSYGKTYSLEFAVKNNFDPNFMFFVDDAFVYEPKLLGYFPVAGEVVKSQRYILSSSTISMKKVAKTLRVGFCAPSLTKKRFSDNVQNLSVTVLTSPVIVATKQLANVRRKTPTITMEQTGHTNFLVHVEDAASPFFLVFSARYSPSWSSTLGEHLTGNLFQNAWYITKTGSYDVELYYDSQKYVSIGFLVSLISLFFSLGILYSLRRRAQ